MAHDKSALTEKVPFDFRHLSREWPTFSLDYCFKHSATSPRPLYATLAAETRPNEIW